MAISRIENVRHGMIRHCFQRFSGREATLAAFAHDLIFGQC